MYKRGNKNLGLGHPSLAELVLIMNLLLVTVLQQKAASQMTGDTHLLQEMLLVNNAVEEEKKKKNLVKKEISQKICRKLKNLAEIPQKISIM